MDQIGGSDFDNDVVILGRLEVVQKILKLLSQITGLRIALVARVSDDGWKACAVIDGAGLGLKPGDELELNTTY